MIVHILNVNSRCHLLLTYNFILHVQFQSPKGMIHLAATTNRIISQKSVRTLRNALLEVIIVAEVIQTLNQWGIKESIEITKPIKKKQIMSQNDSMGNP